VEAYGEFSRERRRKNYIDSALGKGGFQLNRGQIAQNQPHSWMPDPEVADQIGKKGICRCAAKTNRDASHFAACGPSNGFNSPVRLLQRAERLGIKDLSFWREFNGSAGSPEKFDADFVFQIGKRLANGSLRDVQLARSLPKALRLNNRNEVSQMT